MRSRTPAVVLVVFSVVWSGCGGGADSSSRTARPGGSLPVDVRAVLGHADERLAVAEAEQRLVATCMGRKGLHYAVEGRAALAEQDRWYRLEDAYRYGPAPGLEVRDFGIAASAPGQPGSAEDPNAARLQSMGEGERAAWFDALQGRGEHMVDFTDPASGTSYGMSADGCLAEARLELYDTFGAYVELNAYPGRFAEMVAARVGVAPRYEAVLHSWAACAERHGFEMTYPGEPAGAVMVAVGGGVTAKVRELERRHHALAVACESEVHIYELGWALTGELLPVVMRDAAGDLARYRALVERARTVLEDG